MKMNELPFVSAVMPIHNEAAYIERSLSAVFSQDYPADRMEIIVADGMSTDRTREIVFSQMKQHPSLSLIDNLGKIVPFGLNAALRCAKGEIIIRVDGHCEIEPDYVSQCVRRLTEGDVDGVGGPIETVGETYAARCIALAMSSNFGVGGVAFRTNKDRAMIVDTVAFPAYTRRVMDKAGPYDEELVRNQDDEYNYRLRELGGKLLLSPDIRSRYYSRGNLASLWRQYFQYGYWKVRVMQKHPRQMKPRQFVPPFFVAIFMLAACAATFSTFGLWLFALVAGSYVLANLVASALTAVRDSRLLPLLPFAFSVLHFAYGLGFLFGLIAFRSRWGDRESKNSSAPGWSTKVH